jgi:hypothetical protein
MGRSGFVDLRRQRMQLRRDRDDHAHIAVAQAGYGRAPDASKY